MPFILNLQKSLDSLVIEILVLNKYPVVCEIRPINKLLGVATLPTTLFTSLDHLPLTIAQDKSACGAS